MNGFQHSPRSVRCCFGDLPLYIWSGVARKRHVREGHPTPGSRKKQYSGTSNTRSPLPRIIQGICLVVGREDALGSIQTMSGWNTTCPYVSVCLWCQLGLIYQIGISNVLGGAQQKYLAHKETEPPWGPYSKTEPRTHSSPLGGGHFL